MGMEGFPEALSSDRYYLAVALLLKYEKEERKIFQVLLTVKTSILMLPIFPSRWR